MFNLECGMSRKEASKKETRRLILDAARKLFLEQGVDKCTMRAIATAAGVSPASIIVHFKNKTALLEAALYEDIEKTLVGALGSLPAHATLLDRLLHIPQVMYEFYDADRNLYRALLRNTTFETEADNPMLTEQMNNYLIFLGELIEQEKVLGKIRPDTDPQLAAASLGSLYMGVLILFFRSPEMTPDTAVSMLTAMTRQYLEGILLKVS